MPGCFQCKEQKSQWGKHVSPPWVNPIKGGCLDTKSLRAQGVVSDGSSHTHWNVPHHARAAGLDQTGRQIYLVDDTISCGAAHLEITLWIDTN